MSGNGHGGSKLARQAVVGNTAGTACVVRYARRATSLWTVPFLLLIVIGILGYADIYLLVPTMPWYVQHLGGSNSQLGVLMGVFSGVALVVRPCSGWLSDRFGSRVSLLLGVAAMSVASLLYVPTGSLDVAVLIRGLHGFGWGLFSVAGAALAAELAPPGRRGASLSIYGMSGGLALALGPLVSSALGGEYMTFIASGASAALAVGLVILLLRRGPLHARAMDPVADAQVAGTASHSSQQGKARGGGALISGGAMLPAGVLLTFMLTYGAVFTFVPVLTEQRHLGNAGWFFTPYAAAMLAYRAFTGGLSDRFGRLRVIALGMLAAALGLGLLAATGDEATLVAAALLYSGGMAAIQPICLAWASDRAPVAERGAAIATAVAAQDLGISAGSLVVGMIIDAAGLSAAFAAAAGLALAGFVLVVALARSPSRQIARQGANCPARYDQ